MNVTKFHPSHLGGLKPKSASERELLATITREHVAELSAWPAVTLWAESRPIACGGALGGVEFWGVVDERCAKHRRELLIAARRFIGGFGWLYANVDMTFTEGCRLLEHLGFTNTGSFTVAGFEQFRYERAA
jgi:hypothetical protein